MSNLNSYTHAMAIDPTTGKPMPKNEVTLAGSYIRLSTEPKPTAADGVKDGDDLLLVDTKEVFIYYKGTWYLQ
jgi:hypothetical protein